MIVRALRWVAVLLVAWTAGVAAQVAIPPAAAHVVDQAGALDPGQAAALDARLAGFEREHGAQVVVLIVPTTAPETIEQYGIRVADQWKLGRRGVDDGVILLLAMQDRAARIEVGYGIEGTLPDATAHRILAEDMAPRLQAGDVAGAVTAGVDRILAVVSGTPLPPPRDDEDARSRTTLVTVAMASVAIGGLLRRLMGRPRAAALTGGGAGLLAAWLAGSWAVGLLAGAIAAALAFTGVFGWLPWSSGGGGSSFRGRGGGFGGGGASGRW